MKPRTKPIKRTAVKRKPRKASEFARIYGSKARVAFVKSMTCCLCRDTPCDNAHVKGKSGMGRKGDYTTIAALCRFHHAMYDGGKMDGWGLTVVQNDPDKVEAAWQKHTENWR